MFFFAFYGHRSAAAACKLFIKWVFLIVSDREPSCEDNPCGDSTKKLPREDKRCVFDCDPLCLEVVGGGAAENCELIQVSGKLRCEDGNTHVTIRADGNQEANCGKNKVWSDYRSRCIRIFKSG